jgi:hypothetical protein
MKKVGFVVMVLAVATLIAAAPASAANSLTVTAGAALNTTSFGLSVNVDPAASNAVYVQSSHPTDETHMEIRFRVRVGALTAPISGAGRNFRMLNMADDASAGTPHKIIFLQRQNTGNWRLLAWTYNNSSSYEFVGGFFLAGYLNAADRHIRCEWTKATAGPNGSFRCERTDNPGSVFFQRTDISDSNFQTDLVQAGFFDFDGFGTNGGGGALHFDEYESYR